MIERYSDHAANERTFLAWVRTAIAIMAFGFLVQKFDLFLRVASESLTARFLPERSHIVGDIAGLLLIVLGGAMMVLAVLRFRKTTLDIDAGEVRPGPGTRLGYYPRYAAFPAGGNPICLPLIYCDQSALTNSADLRRCGARRGRC